MAYGVWGITFLCSAWVLNQALQPSPVAVLVMVGCLIAIVVVGIADTRAQRGPRLPGR